MLTDDVRARLRDPIDQRLTGSDSEVMPCTLKLPGAFGQEGLLGLDAGRMVFAHTDFVRGVVTLDWTRSQLSGLHCADSFLGREVVGETPDGELKITCRRPEELTGLEAALERFGWFGADPVATPPPAPAPPSVAPPARSPDPAAPPEPAAVLPSLAEAPPQQPPAPPAPPPSPVVLEVAEPGPDLDRGSGGSDAFFEFEEAAPAPAPAPSPADEIACALCGRLNEPHFKYCLSCGAGLPDSQVLAVGGPSLLCLRGAAEGQLFILSRQATIGRTPDNDVHVAMSSLSRRHCRIVQEGRAWTLVDLASSNGTRHNGRLISGPTALQDGDRIVLGDCEFQFVAGGAGSGSSASSRPPAAPTPAASASSFIVMAALVALLVGGLVAFLLASPG